jgi:hypothetical protein
LRIAIVTMNRILRSTLVLLTAGSLPLLHEASTLADSPAGYLGKPFDLAVAAGVGHIPPTVKAGPHPIPGRLDCNYDDIALGSGELTGCGHVSARSKTVCADR